MIVNTMFQRYQRGKNGRIIKLPLLGRFPFYRRFGRIFFPPPRCAICQDRPLNKRALCIGIIIFVFMYTIGTLKKDFLQRTLCSFLALVIDKVLDMLFSSPSIFIIHEFTFEFLKGLSQKREM